MPPVSAASSSVPATTSQSASPLASLSSNFGNFLNLLMTQLKNQDPTSPMDANQFTSELVQFSSVEQQISTNSNLSQLIQLTQSADVIQASSLIGKQVSVQSKQVPLQNGSGMLNFVASTAEPVTITLTNASGASLRQVTMNAAKGTNTWNWDGKNASGQSLPDGGYTVTVTGALPGAAPTSIPFTVVGTATGVTTLDNAVNLQLGTLSVPFTAVKGVGN